MTTTKDMNLNDFPEFLKCGNQRVSELNRISSFTNEIAQNSMKKEFKLELMNIKQEIKELKQQLD